MVTLVFMSDKILGNTVEEKHTIPTLDLLKMRLQLDRIQVDFTIQATL